MRADPGYVATIDVAQLQRVLAQYPADGSARQRLLRRAVCTVALAVAADGSGWASGRDVRRRMPVGPSLAHTLLDELVTAGAVECDARGRYRVGGSS